MIIGIQKTSKDIKHSAPDLITRPVGRKIYAKIREKMVNISDHEVVVLDFEGIQVIDSSFIDEFIVRLIVESWANSPVYYVKLKNISEIAEINIDSVFKSFSNYNNRNIAVISEDICRNNSFFIGTLKEIEKDIIEYLRINKSVLLDDIISLTSLDKAYSNETVNELYQQRLIRKFNNAISSV